MSWQHADEPVFVVQWKIPFYIFLLNMQLLFDYLSEIILKQQYK